MRTLAKENKWGRDFILFELPLAEALQYRHAIRRAEGYWTVTPDAAPTEQLSRLKKLLADEAQRSNQH